MDCSAIEEEEEKKKEKKQDEEKKMGGGEEGEKEDNDDYGEGEGEGGDEDDDDSIVTGTDPMLMPHAILRDIEERSSANINTWLHLITRWFTKL